MGHGSMWLLSRGKLGNSEACGLQTSRLGAGVHALPHACQAGGDNVRIPPLLDLGIEAG